jgi:hypothetical protein
MAMTGRLVKAGAFGPRPSELNQAEPQSGPFFRTAIGYTALLQGAAHVQYRGMRRIGKMGEETNDVGNQRSHQRRE